MERYIAGYRKTEHFLLRQRDRDVSDTVLREALRCVEKPKGHVFLVISRNLVRRCTNKKCTELLIQLDGEKLVTCFYCDFQEYLGRKRKQNYRVIN